jgi:hypothetical protein
MAFPMFGGQQPPQPTSEPPPVKRGDMVGAARAGLDVPHVTFVLWMIANRRIGRGDLVADRREVRR